MEIFRAVFYGLISGLAEFMPISAAAHQYIFSYMTGFSDIHPFLKLMVTLASLASILLCCRKRLHHIYRELRLASLPKKRRKRVPDMQAVSDFRLVSIGLIPTAIGLIFHTWANDFFGSLPWLCLTLIATGICLYLFQFIPFGNHDSRNLRPLDGMLLGLCCVLSMIPGISRMALLAYFGRIRRCGREYCLDLALLFSIPYLFGLALVQLVLLLIAGAATVTGAVALTGLLAAAAAFGAGVAGISLMRYFAVKMDFYGFSYYCWGLSVFCFIYYLMT